jgi:hypothetical protein
MSVLIRSSRIRLTSIPAGIFMSDSNPTPPNTPRSVSNRSPRFTTSILIQRAVRKNCPVHGAARARVHLAVKSYIMHCVSEVVGGDRCGLSVFKTHTYIHTYIHIYISSGGARRRRRVAAAARLEGPAALLGGSAAPSAAAGAGPGRALQEEGLSGARRGRTWRRSQVARSPAVP